MQWNRKVSDWLLVGLWVAAGLVYFALWATAGYAGWATGFTVWSLIAVPLLVGTNAYLRRLNRAAVHVEREQQLAWITIGSVAIVSQLAVTLPNTAWPETPLFRVIGWALVALVWALLIGELGVVGCLSYRVVRRLASSEFDAACPAKM